MRLATPLLLALSTLIDPMRIAMRAHNTEGIEWTPFTFTSDAGETTDAERGFVMVAERHSKPGGATIKLPIIRFKSKAAKPGTPVIYVAGGPGSSGLASARRDQYFPAAMALRENHDVIFYDQRGTGAAEPSLNLTLRFNAPSSESVTSEKSRESFRQTADSAAKLIRSKGVDLDAYNTQENADDLDTIREALGLAKIALWGHSYGSHLTLAYLKRHGAHVSRAIIGGINGLDQRWRYPSEGEAWLNAIDTETKRDPRLKAVMPDFIGTTRRAIARLDSAPARVQFNGQEVFIGADELRTLFVLQGGESDFVKRLPLIVSSLDKGVIAPYAPAVQSVLRNRALGTAMLFSMHIASGVSQQQLDRIARESNQTILRDAINYPFSDPGFRSAWGISDLGESFRARVVSSVPVLMISGTLDGRTSIAAANDVRKGLRNGTQIIVRGAAHDIYTETPVLVELMQRFMNGERLRDTTLTIPVEFHGPDEAALTNELHTLVLDKGVDAAAVRARELRNAPGIDMTSYVLENVADALNKTDKRPQDAVAMLRTATEMFPQNPVLQLRLGGLLMAAGDSTGAAQAYTRAVNLNPLLRYGTVQLSKLSQH